MRRRALSSLSHFAILVYVGQDLAVCLVRHEPPHGPGLAGDANAIIVLLLSFLHGLL